MKKQYRLQIHKFCFVDNPFESQSKEISCSEISVNSAFCMTVHEQIRNKNFQYVVDVTTVNNLKEYFSIPGFSFWQRVALVDCSLIDRIATQMQIMLDKANQYEGFIPADYSYGQKPAQLAHSYLSYYFRSTDLGLDFGSDIEPGLPIDKIRFCGEKPWELDTKNGYERYLLTAGLFSFCSWRFASESKINDLANFHVTIIFTVYDHVWNRFFEVTIDACSLLFLDRKQNSNMPLLFLRYTMIMDRWDERFIKEYVFYTVRAAYGDDPGYYGSPLAQLTFNYQFSRQYLEMAEEWGVQYAYY